MDHKEAICYPRSPLTSAGLWLEENPFGAALPLLMTQIATIVAVSHVLHSFLQNLRQPLIVSQLLTGLILGPSGLGRLSFFRDVLYPERSRIQLDMVGFVGLIMFRFVIGLKTDVSMITKVGKKPMFLALAGRVTPMAFVLVARAYFWSSLPVGIIDSNILTGLYNNWSSSSFIVVTCLLNELNLLNSKIGRLAISASLVDNLFDTLFRILGSTVLSSLHGTYLLTIGVFFTFCVLVTFIVTVARPVALCIIKRTPDGEQLDEKYFTLILVLALGVGLLSEAIGYHAGVGMLLIGLALPSGKPLGYTVVERLESVITILMIPVLMAKPGFISDTSSLMEDVRFWQYLQFFIILSVVGKFCGLMFCSVVCCKMPALEALPLSLIMCTKGFYEVERLLTWMDQLMIGTAIATTFALSIVLIAGIITPMITAFYKPYTQYTDCSVRTIQHSNDQNCELNILVCIHGQENVTPVLNLLQTIHPNSIRPMRLTVLHLVQLVGRATTVLAPYTMHKSSNFGVTQSDSDHIMNAFWQFEQQQKTDDGVVLQPFVSISPHATMHDDVCTLALDMKVCLVILPFHKELIAGYNQSVPNQALQTVNNNVIDYVSCSVAVLVNRRSFSGLLENIAMYFIGGADDREALALAMRMAKNSKVTVTIFRLVSPEESGEEGEAGGGDQQDEEEKADEEMLSGAKANKGVVYREEVVRDSERLLSVIQSTNVGFDLLVAGRRDGLSESRMTSGLSVWREFAELGVIGDMLASSDFNNDFSILVVQQQINNHGSSL